MCLRSLSARFVHSIRMRSAGGTDRSEPGLDLGILYQFAGVCGSHTSLDLAYQPLLMRDILFQRFVCEGRLGSLRCAGQGFELPLRFRSGVDRQYSSLRHGFVLRIRMYTWYYTFLRVASGGPAPPRV